MGEEVGILRHLGQGASDLASLHAAIEDATTLLILPHNDPDPDAIASSVALKWLVKENWGVESHIVYRGIVGRAENKALVRYLGYPLRLLVDGELSESLPIALIDTQAGAGNNAFPPSRQVAIVFDHHPKREETSSATFADVRPEVGSTSTILTEYCRAAGTELPPSIATALFYGIKTDTMGLGRGASPADVAAYFYLQSRVDVQALVKIERAQVSPEYFKGLVSALRSAEVYEGILLISTIDEMQRPDLPAEMADLLLRLKGVKWVICMGVYEEGLMLSVRSDDERGAGQLTRGIVGNLGSAGGHGAMAAGQVRLDGQTPGVLFHRLKRRALERLGIDPDASAEPLI
jgi:nanoRNase/pAp phosphatase (c-di-AMP/oligoRNAs hydrolase)